MLHLAAGVCDIQSRLNEDKSYTGQKSARNQVCHEKQNSHESLEVEVCNELERIIQECVDIADNEDNIDDKDVDIGITPRAQVDEVVPKSNPAKTETHPEETMAQEGKDFSCEVSRTLPTAKIMASIPGASRDCGLQEGPQQEPRTDQAQTVSSSSQEDKKPRRDLSLEIKKENISEVPSAKLSPVFQACHRTDSIMTDSGISEQASTESDYSDSLEDEPTQKSDHEKNSGVDSKNASQESTTESEISNEKSADLSWYDFQANDFFIDFKVDTDDAPFVEFDPFNPIVLKGLGSHSEGLSKTYDPSDHDLYAPCKAISVTSAPSVTSVSPRSSPERDTKSHAKLTRNNVKKLTYFSTPWFRDDDEDGMRVTSEESGARRCAKVIDYDFVMQDETWGYSSHERFFDVITGQRILSTIYEFEVSDDEDTESVLTEPMPKPDAENCASESLQERHSFQNSDIVKDCAQDRGVVKDCAKENIVPKPEEVRAENCASDSFQNSDVVKDCAQGRGVVKDCAKENIVQTEPMPKPEEVRPENCASEIVQERHSFQNSDIVKDCTKENIVKTGPMPKPELRSENCTLDSSQNSEIVKDCAFGFQGQDKGVVKENIVQEKVVKEDWNFETSAKDKEIAQKDCNFELRVQDRVILNDCALETSAKNREVLNEDCNSELRIQNREVLNDCALKSNVEVGEVLKDSALGFSDEVLKDLESNIKVGEVSKGSALGFSDEVLRKDCVTEKNFMADRDTVKKSDDRNGDKKMNKTPLKNSDYFSIPAPDYLSEPTKELLPEFNSEYIKNLEERNSECNIGKSQKKSCSEFLGEQITDPKFNMSVKPHKKSGSEFLEEQNSECTSGKSQEKSDREILEEKNRESDTVNFDGSDIKSSTKTVTVENAREMHDIPKENEGWVENVREIKENVVGEFEGEKKGDLENEGDKIKSPENEGDKIISPENEGDKIKSPENEGDKIISPENEGDKIISPENEGDKIKSPDESEQSKIKSTAKIESAEIPELATKIAEDAKLTREEIIEMNAKINTAEIAKLKLKISSGNKARVESSTIKIKDKSSTKMDNEKAKIDSAESTPKTSTENNAVIPKNSTEINDNPKNSTENNDNPINSTENTDDLKNSTEKSTVIPKTSTENDGKVEFMVENKNSSEIDSAEENSTENNVKVPKTSTENTDNPQTSTKNNDHPKNSSENNVKIPKTSTENEAKLEFMVENKNSSEIDSAEENSTENTVKIPQNSTENNANPKNSTKNNEYPKNSSENNVKNQKTSTENEAKVKLMVENKSSISESPGIVSAEMEKSYPSETLNNNKRVDLDKKVGEGSVGGDSRDRDCVGGDSCGEKSCVGVSEMPNYGNIARDITEPHVTSQERAGESFVYSIASAESKGTFEDNTDAPSLVSPLTITKGSEIELESEMKGLKSEEKQLKSEMKELKSDMKDLKSEEKQLKSEMKKLKSEEIKLKSEGKLLDFTDAPSLVSPSTKTGDSDILKLESESKLKSEMKELKSEEIQLKREIALVEGAVDTVEKNIDAPSLTSAPTSEEIFIYEPGFDSKLESEGTMEEGIYICPSDAEGYIQGPGSVTTEVTGYIQGPGSVTTEVSGYIQGPGSVTTEVAGYIQGPGSVTTEVTGYIQGAGSVTTEVTGYIQGPGSVTTDVTGYKQGPGSQTTYERGACHVFNKGMTEDNSGDDHFDLGAKLKNYAVIPGTISQGETNADVMNGQTDSTSVQTDHTSGRDSTICLSISQTLELPPAKPERRKISRNSRPLRRSLPEHNSKPELIEKDSDRPIRPLRRKGGRSKSRDSIDSGSECSFSMISHDEIEFNKEIHPKIITRNINENRAPEINQKLKNENTNENRAPEINSKPKTPNEQNEGVGVNESRESEMKKETENMESCKDMKKGNCVMVFLNPKDLVTKEKTQIKDVSPQETQNKNVSPQDTMNKNLSQPEETQNKDVSPQESQINLSQPQETQINLSQPEETQINLSPQETQINLSQPEETQINLSPQETQNKHETVDKNPSPQEPQDLSLKTQDFKLHPETSDEKSAYILTGGHGPRERSWANEGHDLTVPESTDTPRMTPAGDVLTFAEEGVLGNSCDNSDPLIMNTPTHNKEPADLTLDCGSENGKQNVTSNEENEKILETDNENEENEKILKADEKDENDMSFEVTSNEENEKILVANSENDVNLEVKRENEQILEANSENDDKNMNLEVIKEHEKIPETYNENDMNIGVKWEDEQTQNTNIENDENGKSLDDDELCIEKHENEKCKEIVTSNKESDEIPQTNNENKKGEKNDEKDLSLEEVQRCIERLESNLSQKIDDILNDTSDKAILMNGSDASDSSVNDQVDPNNIKLLPNERTSTPINSKSAPKLSADLKSAPKLSADLKSAPKLSADPKSAPKLSADLKSAPKLSADPKSAPKLSMNSEIAPSINQSPQNELASPQDSKTTQSTQNKPSFTTQISKDAPQNELASPLDSKSAPKPQTKLDKPHTDPQIEENSPEINPLPPRRKKKTPPKDQSFLGYETSSITSEISHSEEENQSNLENQENQSVPVAPLRKKKQFYSLPRKPKDLMPSRPSRPVRRTASSGSSRPQKKRVLRQGKSSEELDAVHLEEFSEEKSSAFPEQLEISIGKSSEEEVTAEKSSNSPGQLELSIEKSSPEIDSSDLGVYGVDKSSNSLEQLEKSSPEIDLAHLGVVKSSIPELEKSSAEIDPADLKVLVYCVEKSSTSSPEQSKISGQGKSSPEPAELEVHCVEKPSIASFPGEIEIPSPKSSPVPIRGPQENGTPRTRNVIRPVQLFSKANKKISPEKNQRKILNGKNETIKSKTLPNRGISYQTKEHQSKGITKNQTKENKNRNIAHQTKENKNRNITQQTKEHQSKGITKNKTKEHQTREVTKNQTKENKSRGITKAQTTKTKETKNKNITNQTRELKNSLTGDISYEVEEKSEQNPTVQLVRHVRTHSDGGSEDDKKPTLKRTASLRVRMYHTLQHNLKNPLHLTEGGKLRFSKFFKQKQGQYDIQDSEWDYADKTEGESYQNSQTWSPSLFRACLKGDEENTKERTGERAANRDTEFLAGKRDAEFLAGKRDAEFLAGKRDAEFLAGKTADDISEGERVADICAGKWAVDVLEGEGEAEKPIVPERHRKSKHNKNVKFMSDIDKKEEASDSKKSEDDKNESREIEKHDKNDETKQISDNDEENDKKLEKRDDTNITDDENDEKTVALGEIGTNFEDDGTYPSDYEGVFWAPPEVPLRTWAERQGVQGLELPPLHLRYEDEEEVFMDGTNQGCPVWLCDEDTPSPGPPVDGDKDCGRNLKQPQDKQKEDDRTQKDRCVEVYPETVRQRQRNMMAAANKVDIKNWNSSGPNNNTINNNNDTLTSPSKVKKFLPSVKALRNQFETGKANGVNSNRPTETNGTINGNTTNGNGTQSRKSSTSSLSSTVDRSNSSSSLHSPSTSVENLISPVDTVDRDEPVEPIFNQFKKVDQELKELMSKPPSTTGWNPRSLLKRLYYIPEAPRLQSQGTTYVNIEGYLEKLPSGRKKATFWNAWKRRYFVAKDGVLYYYQGNQTEKPSMKMSLMGGRVESMDPNMVGVDDGSRDTKASVMLGIDDGKGHYVVVRCSSRQEAERWRRALETHTVEDFASQYVQPWPMPTNPTLLRDTLVIDIGSASIRAGILASQATLPQVFMPSVVANSREGRRQVWGFDALAPEVRSGSSIAFPIRPSQKISKYSVDLSAVSSLLQKTFAELKVDPKNYHIQLSVPRVLNTNTQAELLRVLFDKHGVRSVNLTHQSILALYAYNATSGIVVDVGERMDIVPVIDGYIVDGGVSRVPYGGYRILDHLRQFLYMRNISLINEVESYIIRHVLENVCYSANHYNTEKARCTNNPDSFEKSVSLKEFFTKDCPYESIPLDFGRFQATEGLFNPDAWGLDHPGLHKLVHKAIMECSMDIRKEMSRSIFLAGGVTQMPGLADRLTTEIDNLTPPAIRPKVHASPYRYHAAYIGACVLAESPAFAQSRISKEDFTKYGNSALRKWSL